MRANYDVNETKKYSLTVIDITLSDLHTDQAQKREYC